MFLTWWQLKRHANRHRSPVLWPLRPIICQTTHCLSVKQSAGLGATPIHLGAVGRVVYHTPCRSIPPEGKQTWNLTHIRYRLGIMWEVCCHWQQLGWPRFLRREHLFFISHVEPLRPVPLWVGGVQANWDCISTSLIFHFIDHLQSRNLHQGNY